MERVDAVRAAAMLRDSDVVLIDVLPESVFNQEHLPGARNLPLETFRPAQVESFDRSATLLVYCFDQH